MKIEEIINELIKTTKADTNQISDGYHTFKELYDHRIVLFIVLANTLYKYEGIGWKSKIHSDGTTWEGWFIAGLRTEKGLQISYHLPIDMWNKLRVVAYDKAPEWDGHTPKDVVERLLNL